jgi:predicted nucleic acid-binding protein
VIVVDASVLIAHLDERDAQHASALERLLAVAEHPLGASPITLAEVLVGPARQGRIDVARSVLQALDVRELPFGADAPSRLASLRADTSLMLPDCCVILAAQDVQAAGILTFDARLRRVAARLGFA